MTEKNSWITLIQNEIGALELPQTNKIQFYLFGSALFSIHPNDIDLLVVYDSTEVSINKVNDFRRDLSQLLNSKLEVDVDIYALTTTEAAQSRFVSREHCVSLSL